MMIMKMMMMMMMMMEASVLSLTFVYCHDTMIIKKTVQLLCVFVCVCVCVCNLLFCCMLGVFRPITYFFLLQDSWVAKILCFLASSSK